MAIKQQILIVDDEEEIRFAVSELLRSRGYDVFAAECSAEALAILEKEKVDLVVLDIDLGNESGLDLLKNIKEAFPQVIIVMLTSRGYDEKAWETARARGANGYLSKYLPPTQLVLEVNRWLRHREKSPGPNSGPSPG